MNQFLRRSQLSACMVFCLLTADAYSQHEVGNDLDSTDFQYPVVITPTRLRQSLADVPASVTVITAETIKRHGISNIPDALRLVPGMAVTRSTGNEYRINHHGTSLVSPRRLNVLIDGVSAYRPTLSRVEWSMLPVAMEDIDRIEVTRGPDSASYGPNSMMAVVNILTKRPKDVERVTAALQVGSHHSVDSTLRWASTAGTQTHISLTANTSRDSGYERATLQGGAHDSSEVKRLNFRAQTELSKDSALEWQASLAQAKRQINFTEDPFELTYPDQSREEVQVSSKWTKALSAQHELQIRAYHNTADNRQGWRTCWPQLAFHPDVTEVLATYPELAYALARGQDLSTVVWRHQPTLTDIAKVTAAAMSLGGWDAALNQRSCGSANLDILETRTQVELQDTFVASDNLRFVTGLGLRYQDASSQSTFDGKVNNQVRWLFGHMEYRPHTSLTINIGGYGEANSRGPSTFSPRVAANVHLTDSQSLRAVYSRGTRTPDLIETQGHVAPFIEDLDQPVMGVTAVAPVQLFFGNPDLKAERIASIELGYLVALRRWGLTLDTRVFSERLTHLISDYNANYEFFATNNGRVRLDGLEAQANWDGSNGWSGWVGYSYLLNRQTSNPVEVSQWSRQSGSAGLSKGFDSRWRASVSHYLSSGNGINEKLYERTDLTLSRDFILDTLPATAMLALSYLHTPVVNTYKSSIGYYAHSHDQRISLNGKVRVTF